MVSLSISLVQMEWFSPSADVLDDGENTNAAHTTLVESSAQTIDANSPAATTSATVAGGVTAKVGDTVKVLIEEMEDELGAADDPYGMISLSKTKAEKIIEWEKIIGEISEGQVVTGTVIRKIKGGLLVDIGVNVF